MDEDKQRGQIISLRAGLGGLRQLIADYFGDRRRLPKSLGENLNSLRLRAINLFDPGELAHYDEIIPPVSFVSDRFDLTGQQHVDAGDAYRLARQLYWRFPILEPSEESDQVDMSLVEEMRDLNRKVFVVHGHDDVMKIGVARFLEKIDIEPIILHEQVSKNSTIIEKIEAYSVVSYTVVLLSPDDPGATRTYRRARQNVILELGYFTAKIGRSRVLVLKKGNIELPSDLLGVIWTEFDDAGAWKMALAREINAAGIPVDFGKAAHA